MHQRLQARVEGPEAVSTAVLRPPDGGQRAHEPPTKAIETRSVSFDQHGKVGDHMTTGVGTTRPHRVRERRRARLWVVAASATMLLTSSAAVGAGVAASSPLGDPNEIAHWNQVAQTTLLGDTTKRPQEHFLYLAFMNIAMYDVVVGVHGRYQPFAFHGTPGADVVDQVAAAAAAHHILETYSPYAQSTLNTALGVSTSVIPDGPAKDHSIAYGRHAAQALIDARVGDGRNAAVLFTKPEGPGVWRPTPPLFQPMFVPWMGGVTPLVPGTRPRSLVPGT